MEAAAGSTSSALTAPIFMERADTSITPTSNGNCEAERMIGNTYRNQESKLNLNYLILHL